MSGSRVRGRTEKKGGGASRRPRAPRRTSASDAAVCVSCARSAGPKVPNVMGGAAPGTGPAERGGGENDARESGQRDERHTPRSAAARPGARRGRGAAGAPPRAWGATIGGCGGGRGAGGGGSPAAPPPPPAPPAGGCGDGAAGAGAGGGRGASMVCGRGGCAAAAAAAGRGGPPGARKRQRAASRPPKRRRRAARARPRACALGLLLRHGAGQGRRPCGAGGPPRVRVRHSAGLRFVLSRGRGLHGAGDEWW